VRCWYSLISQKVHIAVDDLDRAILGILSEQGRLSNKDLASQLGIAESTCHARVKGLEKSGVLRGFRPDIDHSKLGLQVEALISVRIRPAGRVLLREIGRTLAAETSVLDVYFVAGAFDFVLRVAARGTEEIRDFVATRLSTDACIESTQTSLIFEHIPGH
jgi:DNA-binding Lrp family transcriptional regulator